MSGIQCAKQLWWRVHEPDADELVPDSALQARFDQAHEVEARARTYVPGGVLIEGHNLQAKLDDTRRQIEAGAEILYEAALEYDGIVAIIDILTRRDGGWNLIEVKASTRVKAEHIPDVGDSLLYSKSVCSRINVG